MFENKSIQETSKDLGVNIETGLSSKEANERLLNNGENKLAEGKKKNAFVIFFSQMKDLMVLILFIAAIVSLVVGIVEANGENRPLNIGDFADVIIIFGVVLLNSTIGTIQELKAEKALEALKKMSSPTATVKRDGKLIEIKASELVVGDIVILEEGRSVPADIRLIKSFSLKANESSLTGESVAVEKNANLVLSDEVGVGDRLNEVYMSTTIAYGRGEGIVISTGMNTEIGKIAKMLSSDEQELTPLQKQLNKLSKFISYLTISVVVLMFGIYVIYHLVDNTFVNSWPRDLLSAVSLAVAAIPEGLTAVVTIVLALGMQRMVKANTIVRRLASVETLGTVSVICSDKTGTLTQNKMTVVETYINGKTYSNNEFNKDNNEILAIGMCLCSDASIENGEYGDPTEIALVSFADKLGMSKSSLEKKYPRVDELPFDSVRKMMSTRHNFDGNSKVFTKGAIDQILKNVTKIEIDGKVRAIKDSDIKDIMSAANAMSQKALRVLALAYNTKDKIEESDLVFVGFVGMIDPPREAAKPAVMTLKKAGITTIMITGDHKDTAFAIAKELGIVDSIDNCMSGDQIDACSPEELKEKVKIVRVFARVSPENKVQIVKAIKANNLIVAMTGDGVNDAPSLKAADIGVAMGITGTDVAKDAADMVLTDDNFASIEKAVEEGRGMYANIKKTILFLLSSNIGEVICMFVAACLGLPVPLIAVHLLLVNLVTDSLPAVALGAGKKPKGIMNDKPRGSDESIFAHGGYSLTFGYGALIGFATLIAFLINPWVNGCYTLDAIKAYFENPNALAEAQSMAFTVLAVSELFHMFGMVDPKHSIVTIVKNSTWLVWLSFFLGLGIQLFIMEVPGVNTFFKVHTLNDNPIDWLYVILLAISPLVVHEIVVFINFIVSKAKKSQKSI